MVELAVTTPPTYDRVGMDPEGIPAKLLELQDALRAPDGLLCGARMGSGCLALVEGSAVDGTAPSDFCGWLALIDGLERAAGDGTRGSATDPGEDLGRTR